MVKHQEKPFDFFNAERNQVINPDDFEIQFALPRLLGNQKRRVVDRWADGFRGTIENERVVSIIHRVDAAGRVKDELDIVYIETVVTTNSGQNQSQVTMRLMRSQLELIMAVKGWN